MSAETDIVAEARALLADGALLRAHEPTVIPPCRVCGAPLTLQAIGGGEPTKWGCGGWAPSGDHLLPGRRLGDAHYDESVFVDRKHADPRVPEALRLLAALCDEAAQVRDEVVILRARVRDLSMSPSETRAELTRTRDAYRQMLGAREADRLVLTASAARARSAEDAIQAMAREVFVPLNLLPGAPPLGDSVLVAVQELRRECYARQAAERTLAAEVARLKARRAVVCPACGGEDIPHFHCEQCGHEDAPPGEGGVDG